MLSFLAEIIKTPGKFDCLKDPIVLQLESLTFTPFHLISLILFVCAIMHTLTVHKVYAFAHTLENRQAQRRIGKRRPRSFLVQFFYFLSEVEIVFAFWGIPLFLAISCSYGWHVALDYIDTRDYTEPLFVVIVLAMASTRPIVHVAERLIHWIAKGLGGSLAAWWFTLLTVGPLLGSFITEAGAMVLCALLLSQQFYHFHPSPKLSYATLGLLFVNISVGGILTDFASPAALILAHAWKWTTWDMFSWFGCKATVGIILSNLLFLFCFRKELYKLGVRKKAMSVFSSYAIKHPPVPIPLWVTIIHIFFMIWIVVVSHYPAIFIASFLFFVGFHQATRPHQTPISLSRPLLVGLFLAGLVIHGGLQGWWVVTILTDQHPMAVMGAGMLLTAFNDNASISYLATLIPDWSYIYKYAIFTGVVAGGGLTVIANAPNPAGYAILRKFFEGGVKPLRLFFWALIPTLILYLLFYFVGPLFHL